MSRPPTFYHLPAGRLPKPCKSCGTPMYWIETPNGKALPIDVLHAESVAPTATTAGKGTAHWASCSNPNAHRTPRTKPAA